MAASKEHCISRAQGHNRGYDDAVLDARMNSDGMIDGAHASD